MENFVKMKSSTSRNSCFYLPLSLGANGEVRD